MFYRGLGELFSVRKPARIAAQNTNANALVDMAAQLANFTAFKNKRELTGRFEKQIGIIAAPTQSNRQQTLRRSVVDQEGINSQIITFQECSIVL